MIIVTIKNKFFSSLYSYLILYHSPLCIRCTNFPDFSIQMLCIIHENNIINIINIIHENNIINIIHENNIINITQLLTGPLAKWVEGSPIVRETGVQSQVESYQRLKKWYLMWPGLTLSIIRYGSRVKWSNPGKGVAPFPTQWWSSYWKGSFRVTLDCGR